jgi:hypothetical protein
MVAKKSTVGTKAVDWSFGWLPPPGTSMLSKPGPSLLMWMGVPSVALDERCSVDRCPIRCSFSSVPVPCAVCRASLGPRFWLGRIDGPPPSFSWSAKPEWIAGEWYMYCTRSVKTASSPGGAVGLAMS